MDPTSELRMLALNTTMPNLADEHTLADGPPGNQAEMPWISVHTTWQPNLLWLMEPPPHSPMPNENFTLLLTSSGQEWQFDIATDILWSRMAIWHCYWHLLVKNGNLTELLTSNGQQWQFHIATDILWSRMAIGRSILRSASRSTPSKCTIVYILRDLFGSHFVFCKKRWEFPVFSE